MVTSPEKFHDLLMFLGITINNGLAIRVTLIYILIGALCRFSAVECSAWAASQWAIFVAIPNNILNLIYISLTCRETYCLHSFKICINDKSLHGSESYLMQKYAFWKTFSIYVISLTHNISLTASKIYYISLLFKYCW